jgi:hypothetical protein
MKTRWAVLVCVLAAWLAAGAFAGERQDPRERALRERLDELTDKLALTDAQLEKVRKLYTDSFDEMRRAWENRGERSREAIQVAQERSRQVLKEKIVPLLEKEQVTLYAAHLAERAKASAAAVIEAAKAKLGMTDEAWARIEPDLKKLGDLKAELAAKLDIARAQLRDLLDKSKDDVAAIGSKLKEIDALRKELTAKIDEAAAALRKKLTDSQWAQLVLEGAVE